MADPFVAEIRIFPFNFAPKGWAFCDGQLLPLLSAAEKKQLDATEGVWPDYHRTLMKLADDHGLSVPGLSLPGGREFWDRLAAVLPDESDHLLIEFAATLNDKDLAAIQFSPGDRVARERLKDEYYRRNPERLRKRLLEDYQASLKTPGRG